LSIKPHTQLRERRFLPVREAAEATGVSASSLRRWASAGRINVERQTDGSGAGRTLVDVDQVLLLQAAQQSRPRLAVAPSNESFPTLQLLGVLAVVAQRRVEAADAEVDRLSMRVRELESWIAGSARFDEVEHVQLGRMLAHASAEREESRRPLLSLRATLLFLYAAAALAFAILLVVGV
jgi:DNA-binding transcriptional MerR regulator